MSRFTQPAPPGFKPFLLLDGVDLKLVIQHLSDSVFVSDAEGRILLLNPVSQELLGINIDGQQNVNVHDLLGDGIYEPSTALEAAKRKTTVTELVRSHNGHDNMAISKPVLDDDGNVIMVVTSSRSKQMIDAFLAKAIQEERRQAARYREAASILSETLQQGKPIVTSPAMQAVVTLADTAALSDATVLLMGESGTGKEVVAHYIHQSSRRADEPFIPVNCGAIPQELAEAEFFGYVRGAFTGASPKGKMGLFEMAHQGTLFLDEIGEMPLSVQSKLLRVLETGVVRRIGDTQSRKTNVRIIAATNKNIYDMAQKGLFRMDLYYRLHVVPLTIPPLRERPEDTLELAQCFLDDYNKRYNQKKHFTLDALELFTRYQWPGNVRELRNIVERLAMMPEHQIITAELCATLLHGAVPDRMRTLPNNHEECLTLRDFRSRAEKDYIVWMLEHHNGSVRHAARSLGIHKTALYRKLHTLEIVSASQKNTSA